MIEIEKGAVLRIDLAKEYETENNIIEIVMLVIHTFSGDFGMCEKDCKKGLLGKIKPYAFNLFIKRYGMQRLLDCLEKNEANGVVYHREGINGDYDYFDDVEELISFIETGVHK